LKPTLEEVLTRMRAAPDLNAAALELARSGIQPEVERWLESRDVAFTVRSLNETSVPGPPVDPGQPE